MIINGFGGSSSVNLLDDSVWNDIYTITVSNFSISDDSVLIAQGTMTDYNWDVIRTSRCIRVKEVSLTSSGNIYRTSSTVGEPVIQLEPFYGANSPYTYALYYKEWYVGDSAQTKKPLTSWRLYKYNCSIGTIAGIDRSYTDGTEKVDYYYVLSTPYNYNSTFSMTSGKAWYLRWKHDSSYTCSYENFKISITLKIQGCQ